MTKNPQIGSATLGKMPLAMSDNVTPAGVPKIELFTTRDEQMVQSAQIHLPFLKRAIKKAIRKTLL